MIEMNRNGKLDVENLRIIRDLLLYFEREHDHDKLSSGKLLIKREYVRERISLFQIYIKVVHIVSLIQLQFIFVPLMEQHLLII